MGIKSKELNYITVIGFIILLITGVVIFRNIWSIKKTDEKIITEAVYLDGLLLELNGYYLKNHEILHELEKNLLLKGKLDEDKNKELLKDVKINFDSIKLLLEKVKKKEKLENKLLVKLEKIENEVVLLRRELIIGQNRNDLKIKQIEEFEKALHIIKSEARSIIVEKNKKKILLVQKKVREKIKNVLILFFLELILLLIIIIIFINSIKKVKKELHYSKSNLELAVETAKLGYWELDIEKNKLYWSDEVYRMFDLKEQEFEATYESFLDKIHPDDREKVNSAYINSLENKKKYSIEHRLLLKSGEIKYVEEKCRTDYDQSGKPLKSFGTVQDITNKVRRENKIKNRNKILFAMHELNDLIYRESSVDKILKEGARIFLNSGGFNNIVFVLYDKDLNQSKIFSAGYGEKAGEIENRLKSGFVADCVKVALKSEEKIIIKEKGENCKGCIFSKLHKNGNVFTKKLSYKGNLYGYMMAKIQSEYFEIGENRELFNDIIDEISRVVYSVNLKESEQELREKLIISEERLRFAIDGSGLGLWDLNVESGELFLSKRYKEMLGYRYYEMGSKSKEWLERVHPDDHENVISELEEHINGESGIFRVEYRIMCKDGYYKNILSRGKATFFDEDGKAIRIVGTNMDITEKLERERRLEKSKQLIEKASRAKSDFLSNMSHELRTPITPIIGFTEMLLDIEEDDEKHEMINFIYTSAVRMLGVVESLLNFTEIDRDVLKLEEKEFDLRKMLSVFENNLIYKIENKELEFKMSIGEKVPKLLIGDKSKLGEIILNLISNAIKFTKKGLVKLSVDLKNNFEEKVELEFCIKDSGVGIEKENYDKIFDIFVQGEHYLKKEFGGMGLGLAIVKELVEFLDGKISFESEVGVGSEFRFTIPLKKVKQDEIEIRKVVEISDESFENKKIIAAEDELINQMLLKKIFLKRGVSLDIVSNGEELLEEISSNEYDLILMDVQMPKIDGITATKRIRERGSAIPIIALTAHADSREKQRCFDSGMDIFLKKPFTAKELFEKMQEGFNLS